MNWPWQEKAGRSAELKLYLCINDRSLVAYAGHLKVAINSARWIGKLEPHVLFDGPPERLQNAIGHGDFVIHPCTSSLIDRINDTAEVPGWSRQAAEGALLRLEIPLIERDDEYVMYTDCDVIFTRKIDYSDFRPTFIGAAPGHNPSNWDDICSGVMILNVGNLRNEYDRYMKIAGENLGIPNFYDQEVLNKYFSGKFDRIPLEYHWKAYWAPNPFAYIVHFQGLKRDHIAALENRSPGHESISSWAKVLFVQEEGVKYHAALYDRLDRQALQTGTDLFLWELPEIARFLWKKGLGYGRRLHRSAAPDFDEHFYLYANPDVAVALHNGWIPSGWWHYDSVGRKEGRAARFHSRS